MTREESAKWASLLQAQADGKRLEYKTIDDLYVAHELTIDCMFAATLDRWRIAPDLPPKPSQEIMAVIDRLGYDFDHIGRYKMGDVILTPGHYGMHDYYPHHNQLHAFVSKHDQFDSIHANYIILRLRAPQVKPWTIDTVPSGLCVKMKDIMHRKDCAVLTAIQLRETCVLLLYDNPEGPHFVKIPYDRLLDEYTQRDGSPCGEVVT